MEKSLNVWEIKPGGEPVPLLQAGDSLDELSRALPQGFYSTFRTFGNGSRALGLAQHLRRLYAPAALLGIQPAVGGPELRRTLAALLASCHRGEAQGTPGEARVRISLATRERPGAIFVSIEPLKTPSDEVYQRGVRVVTSPAQRADPRLKSTSFIRQSQAERQAVAASGAFEGLMLRNGRILEGLTSNFYYVIGGALGTAQQGILLGVTRRLVLKLARAAGLALIYRPLALERLPDISEAFITSSSRGIVPVVSIDHLPVGDGRVGPVTRLLMERYRLFVERRAERI